MEALNFKYANNEQMFVQYLDNPIIENAMYHTCNYTLDNSIVVEREDFREIIKLIHPSFKRKVLQALFNMQENNTGYVFWIEDGKICFE